MLVWKTWLKRAKERQISICWLTPNPCSDHNGQRWYRTKLGVLSFNWVAHRVQGPTHLGHDLLPFWVLSQAVGLEMEQPRLEWKLIEDASIIGGSWICCHDTSPSILESSGVGWGSEVGSPPGFKDFEDTGHISESFARKQPLTSSATQESSFLSNSLEY